MGSELGEEPKNTSLKEYLYNLFDYALSIGMTYTQYWEDDPELFAHYYNAEKIRMRKRNNEMWIQGAYIYQAIGNLAPILNGMTKDHHAKPYMKQPIPLTEEEREEMERQKELKFISYMDKLANLGGKKND